ncbi:DUF2842 domain-containing protein [Sagittula salina]|uniref:DUF2842 domain-containing protein n=1 Tax=Sagittula salina TaxID=2820268 RepID=A0A940RZP9_9RHOB|nr:DUF2842 domain-containing protein [Sagittula salina]MBP0481217.1 DUF2842 domain-containing protein [Sagittula salina]
MALSYKVRRTLSLLVLVVGLPLYIGLAIWVVSLFDRPPIWLEFIVYVVLGVLWMLPLKAVFKGVGQADPDGEPIRYEDDGLK